MIPELLTFSIVLLYSSGNIIDRVVKAGMLSALVFVVWNYML